MGKTIVVDWGTSSFRAYRFGASGEIVDRHRADAGIMTVQNSAFEDVLEREIGCWITSDTTLLLSGMITSRNGWFETPYVPTPATLLDLARGAVGGTSRRGASLRFLPGVAQHAPTPDVMRGEEIQVFGVVGADESATVVLPGTHSKWVTVERGAITGFCTFFSGEMFSLLKMHSLIGRLMPPESATADAAAFLAGVDQAKSAQSLGLLNDVFSVRAGVLLGQLRSADIAERLSGILIGCELIAGLKRAHANRLIVVGADTLVRRYQTALAHLGVGCDIGVEDATVQGFCRMARETG